MNELLQIQTEKSELEKKINDQLQAFRERWGDISLDVESCAIHRLGRRDSRVALIVRTGDTKW